MKILKKFLSVFMALSIMLSMLIVDASAEKEKISPPSVKISRSGKYTKVTFTISDNLIETYLKKYEDDNSARIYLKLETALITCTAFLYNGSKINYSVESYGGECVPISEYTMDGGLSKYGFDIIFKFRTNTYYSTRLLMAESGEFTYYLSTSNGKKISYGSSKSKKINLDGNDTSFLNTDVANMWVDEIGDKKYDKEKKTPSVKVTNHVDTLEEGRDYTLSYKNNTKVGTATVIIKGKGKYSGTKKVTFNIVPQKTTLTAKKKSNNKITFKWDKALGAGKYQIYYCDNSGLYRKLATIKGDKTSYTTTKLDFSKNDYRFVIRSTRTIDGKTYYSSFSEVITVK